MGALPLDLSKTPIDFLACGGHKWLLGPLGLGFLYLRRDVQADVWPIEVGHHSVVLDEERYTSYDLRFRDDAERNAVLNVLARVNGNLSKAAEMLGVSRPTLYELMEKLGIGRGDKSAESGSQTQKDAAPEPQKA